MNEHPIIFSTEMVRAILSGRKTHTRRVMKPQPTFDGVDWIRFGDDIRQNWCLDCPFGKIGDRLWVRETWGAVSQTEESAPLEECKIEYRADLPSGSTDYPGEWPADEARGSDIAPKWRPSIHMPRWASRITLEIVKVRVERVQEISLEDSKAEGMPAYSMAMGVLSDNPPDPRWKFIGLWNSINAKRGFGWDSNPWVWVIEFKRGKPE